MLKEAKIAQLHKLRKDVRTLEERYWLNKNLYDEYCVCNAEFCNELCGRQFGQ